ncbi:MAG: asparagine synthase (glutamine-hydrolyzing) [Bacillota bacterium]
MCGITGWIDWRSDLTRQVSVLESMTQALTNRGPDAEGYWVSPRAALGHRRLIVIDPVGGTQPMVRSRDGKEYVIVYNGELYNTVELRSELESRGHNFLSRSDTEVLLVSYMEWGTDCVKKLNGIFAFAIWNEDDHTLFMARDRLGVKPLFYFAKGDTLVFGSELKSLLAHPAVKPKVDATGLAEIFIMGPARTPGHGIFRGVSELKPGCALAFSPDGIHSQCYWALESRPHTDDLRTTALRIRELLQDTVERQLVSDVPVCMLLSGGLDSSALTAFAAGAFKQAGIGPVHSYEVDYMDNDLYFRPSDYQPNSDAPWALKVSSSLGTVHHQVIIDTPQLVEALTDAVRARDLPGMADIDASLYLFSREIKKRATVALSGECADEIFCGYPWFYREDTLSSETFPWVRMIKERVRLLSPELIEQIRPEEYVARRYQEALEEVPRLAGEKDTEARLREIAYLTVTRFMPVLLDRKDRMSMAVGLEVRVPFCDHRLTEYAWNIPWTMKTCDGLEKGILRRALAGLLPEDVLTRRKSPYPKTYNPAYLAAVRKGVREILDDPVSPLLPFINTRVVRELITKDAASTNLPFFGQLMTYPQLLAYLMQVNTWLREYHVTTV